MPSFGDSVRKDVIIGIQADGADVPARVAQEMARLTAELRNSSRDFVDGTTNAKAFKQALADLQGQMNSLAKVAQDLKEARQGGSDKDIAAEEAAYVKARLEMLRAEKELEAQEAKRTAAAQKATEDEEAAYVKAVQEKLRAAKQLEAEEAKWNAATTRDIEQEEAAYVKAVAAKVRAEKQIEAEKAREAADAQRAIEREEAAYVEATMAKLRAEKQLEAEKQREAEIAARAIKAEEDAYVQATLAHLRAQAQLEQTTGGFRRWNQVMIQTGYGIGDLMQTSGSLGQKLMSITNNVQMATVAFGGWGIAAGVMTTLLASLILNWDSLSKALGTATDTTFAARTEMSHLEDTIKRLSDQKLRLAIDDQQLEAAKDRLDEIKADLQAIDDLQKLRTRAQEASGAAVKATLAGAPGGAAMAGAQILRAQQALTLQTPEVQAILAREAAARAGIAGAEAEYQAGPAMGEDPAAFAEAIRNRIGRRREEARIAVSERMAIMRRTRQRVGHVLRGAETGDVSVQGDLADMMEQAGLGGMAGEVRRNTPAYMEQLGRNEIEMDAMGKLMTAARQKQAREYARNEHEMDQLGHRLAADRDRMRNQVQQSQNLQDRQREHEVSRLSGGLQAAIGRDNDKDVHEAVLRGIAAGWNDAQLRANIEGTIGRRAAAAGIDPGLLKDVVEKVVSDTVERTRLELAGVGENQAQAAREALAQQGAKFKGMAERDAKAGLQQWVEADIMAGTGWTPGMSAIAARNAINKMNHGMMQREAEEMAVIELMQQFIMMQEQANNNAVLFQRRLQGLEQRVNGVNRRGQRVQNPGMPALIPPLG